MVTKKVDDINIKTRLRVLIVLIILTYLAAITVLLHTQYERPCWDDPADVTFPFTQHCLGPDPLLN